MSYQIKRSLGTLGTGLLVLVLYCAFALRSLASGGAAADKLAFWARAMLFCMGGLILLMIVMQILFHILFSIGIAIERRNCDEAGVERAIKASMIEDELDELVELKATRIGSMVPALGLVASLIALVLGVEPVLALNLLFLSFLVLPVVSSIAQVLYYRASLPHA